MWSLVVAAGLAALALGVLVALPIVRWILRPVRRLDEGTGRVAAAVLAGAEPEPVADGSGPPELRRLSVSFDRMAETVTQAYARAARLRRRREPPAAQPAHRAAAAAVQPGRARRRRRCRGPRRRARGGRAAVHAARRAAGARPGRAHRAADRHSTSTRAWRTGSTPGGRWPSTADLQLVRGGVRGLRAMAPAGAIETVLDAVLDNAVKFTPPGGPITVRTAVVDGMVEIAVRDTGPGHGPRRAGTRHRPVLAQPGAEQRRGLRARAGDRRPHRSSWPVVSCALELPVRRRAAGGGAAPRGVRGRRRAAVGVAARWPYCNDARPAAPTPESWDR